MMLNRVLMLATVAVAIPVWAFQQSVTSKDGGATLVASADSGVAAINPIIANNGLVPRQPLPKEAFVVKPAGESQLVVKFRDEVTARIRPDKKVQLASPEAAAVDAVATQHRLEFAPLSKKHTQQDLDTLRARAEAYSGRAQPDLAGMMYINGPENELQTAANKLLQMDSVEFVYFQKPWRPVGPPTGACCVGNTCSNTFEDSCTLQGGTFYPNLSCSPGFCLVGACCLKDGTCTESTQGECLAVPNATFFPGETCANNPCPQPEIGSCCTVVEGLPSCDNATNITEALCIAAGGFFVPGGDCMNNDCEIGACCLYPDVCLQMSVVTCIESGGVYRGGDCDGGVCDFECGDDDLASCFVEHGYPYCNNNDCCELVGAYREFCINPDLPTFPPPTWDALCVTLANFLCDPPGPPPGPPDSADRCNTSLNAPCFIEHNTGGCWNPGPPDKDGVIQPTPCCYSVCAIDPFCCTGTWDASCVALAYDLCEFPDDKGPTPDLAAYQGYLRQSPYEDVPFGPAGQLGGRPERLFLPGIPPDFLPGYGGEGWNLFAEGPNPTTRTRLTDDPDMPDDERYEGLYGLGRALHEIYGAGTHNMARGSGIKVAVIEWAFYGAEPFTDVNDNGEYDDGEPFIDHNQDGVRSLGHEDLDVISEPGQTLIMIPSITEPDHATACLGIINAQDNGFGMVGIAPDAEAYFFPLTSVEEGPRASAAFYSCFLEFDAGDVISCSFGPGGSNLNNDPLAWTLMRLGSDLGIQVCVAAGNDCVNMDELAGQDLGDSGAIVVGACTPGAPYCRLSFSNYDRAAPATSSRRVHMSAWGQFVGATGYGDIFMGDGDVNRSYTGYFNGTSAATPQVAGLVACLQGLAKQFFGIPMATVTAGGGSNNIRNLVAAGGFPQCNNQVVGFNPDADCGPDIVPDQPVNRIGPYPQARDAGDSLLSQWSLGYDQSPFIHNMYILRGDRLFGNLFSTKASDNNYVLLQSQYTQRSTSPVLTSPSPEANLLASRVKYLATGYTGDVMFQGQSTTRSETIQIRAEVQVGNSGMLFIEMYDWLANRWSFVGFNQLPANAPGAEAVVTHTATLAGRFFHPETGNMYVRCYTLLLGNVTLGSVGTGASAPALGPYIRIDWVDLRPGFNIGVPPL